MTVQDGATGAWRHYADPVARIQAEALDEVAPALAEVARRVEAEGLHAAGFISYDAAPAFDPALVARQGGALPLVWFGLYATPMSGPLPPPSAEFHLGAWQPTVSAESYTAHIAAIRQAIAQGHTYQVNYTYRLRAGFEGDAYALFYDLAAAQPGGYAAFVDGGDWAICSASPELFFSLNGERLVGRPMKGTARRGLTLADDRAQMEALRWSEKNRAENVMIVDMLRNDLGRVARLGTVQVPSLFDVTRYPTLHQMTSTVSAETDAPFPAILRALFPCASITGAPKVRTMRLIHDLEETPRGVYTGAIGYLAPGRQTQFNVAIRTAVVDRRLGQAEYGVGGGIVWDSDAADEYAETQLKAQVLTRREPAFALLESLLWTPEGGYWLLDRHVGRARESAEYFGMELDSAEIRRTLLAYAASLTRPAKVRLEIHPRGGLNIRHTPLEPAASLRLALAPTHINRLDRFLYHKTTHRAVYEAARAACPGYDDVLLWNEAGEITETTTANVVIQRAGQWVTPPVACGLLGGTLRAQLIAEGILAESIITVAEAQAQDQLWLINSVRGWRVAQW